MNAKIYVYLQVSENLKAHDAGMCLVSSGSAYSASLVAGETPVRGHQRRPG